MAGQALAGAQARARLHVGREAGVIPVAVSQDLGDVLTPARAVAHQRVADDPIANEEAVASNHRLAAFELRRVLFEQQHRTVGQRLPILRGLPCDRVRPQVAYLVDVRAVDGLVHLERRLIALGEGDVGLDERREGVGLRRGVRRLQAAEGGRDVDDVVGAELRGDRVHDRVLARAGLQRAQLAFQVRGALARQVRNVVGDADAVGAVAGRADGLDARLAGGQIRLRCRWGLRPGDWENDR